MGRWRATVRQSTVLIALMVTLGLTSGLTMPASTAADDGHITGTVTGSGGAPLGEISVIAYRAVEGGWDEATFAITGTDGFYDLAGLVAGTYRIKFYDPWQGHIVEYYDDAATRDGAQDITVTAGEVAAGKDAELDPGGHITGKVTNPEFPIAHAYVTALRSDGTEWYAFTSAETPGDGTYDLSRLPTGTYRVLFQVPSSQYVTEYYEDAASVDTALDVSVVAGETTAGIDAELRLRGHVTGVVTGPDGMPLAGASVSAFREGSGGWERTDETAWTEADGSYELWGLPTGTYRVCFGRDGYITEYYDDAPAVAVANSISVINGQITTGINAELVMGGRIAGTVTGPTGDPLYGVDVKAYRQSAEGWREVGETWSTDDGGFELGSLSTGTYRIGFDDYLGGHLSEFYDDAATLGAASDITVTAGQTTRGRDAELALGGHITGSVTGPGGLLPGRVNVIPYRDDGSGWVAINNKSTATMYDGTYDLNALPSGTYRISFVPYPNGRTDEYVSEFYDDAATVAAATDVVVTAGHTTTSINAELGPGGHITGTITGPAGDPLYGVDVKAYQQSAAGWTEVERARSDYEGAYDIGGLQTGAYRVEFTPNYYDDTTHLSEYYDDAATLDAATDIAVTAGQVTSSVDADLALGGRIVGSVQGSGGGFLTDVEVSAYADVGQGWEEVRSTFTNDDGDYLISLPPGAYRVRFHDTAERGYITEWWDDVTAIEAATDVAVPAGAVMTIYARLSGPPTPAVVNIGGPTIIGVRRVGATLAATTGSWDPATELTFSYQWFRGSVPVTGATSSTYTLTAPDVGKKVHVAVEAFRNGYLPTTAESAPAAVSLGVLTVTTKPTLNGKVKRGATLTAAPGTWTPSEVTLTYRWFAGVKPIPHATTPKLRLRGPTAKTAQGKVISVVITVAAAGYTPVKTRLQAAGRLRERITPLA